LIQSIQVGTAPIGFTWQNNLVFYKGRFFLGLQCPLKTQVLQLVHSWSLKFPQVLSEG